MTAWIGNPPLSIPAYPTPVFETGRPQLPDSPDAPLLVVKREPDATGGTHVSFNRPMGTDETVKALFPDAKSWVQIEKEPLIQISGGAGHDWRVTLANGKEVELNFPGRGCFGPMPQSVYVKPVEPGTPYKPKFPQKFPLQDRWQPTIPRPAGTLPHPDTLFGKRPSQSV